MFKINVYHGSAWIDISQYVYFDSLDEFEQIAEGGSMWDYRLDNLDLEIDSSMLDSFELTRNNIQGLINLKSEVYYYEKLVFAGLITHTEYDYTKESLEIGIDSYGKIAAGKDFYDYSTPHDDERKILKNYHTNGDSLALLSDRIKNSLNGRFNADYGLSLPFTRNIDVIDFEFMKSLEGESYTIPDGFGSPKPYYYGLFTYVRPNGDKSYFLWYPENGVVSQFIWVREVHSNGTLGGQGTPGVSQGNLRAQQNKPMEFEDEGIDNFVKTQLGVETLDYQHGGKIKFSDTLYFVVANWQYIFVGVSPDDKYFYNYEDEKIGQILKDFAIMTNSVVWISPDRCINFQNREGSAVVNINPVNVEYETESKKTDKFELPDGQILLDSVRADIVNYYETFLSGNFYNYNIKVQRDQISDSDYPLMLKNIKGVMNGQTVDFGIVKKVKFGEDLIELESEKRLD